MDAEQKKHVMALATGFMNGSLAKEAFYSSLTEAIAKAVGCSRASLWRYGSSLQDTAVCLTCTTVQTISTTRVPCCVKTISRLTSRPCGVTR